MQAKHLHTLELDKVLQRAAALASFSASKELIAQLQPTTDPGEVRRMQAGTTETRQLLATRPTLSIGGAKDIRPVVGRAALGAVLQPPDFLEIGDTLRSALNLKGVFERAHDSYPQLAVLAQRLHPLESLQKDIGDAINERAEVRDDASPVLAKLRSEVKTFRTRIMRRLEAIINDPNNADAIQEPIVTERGGRYVIAVKVGYRSHIRGVVHDQSESGATLFLEPLVAVEMTNEWRQNLIEEQREVERILRMLSSRVALDAAELEQTVQSLAEIDALFARAKLAEQLDAVDPEINEQGHIRLIDARHPLLQGKVVPQTILLGEDFTVLVVTGPNTGGKTVALKTAGLLTLMAQCGFHIPASPGSTISVFEEVLADIGDEQSIEQSLSTFSAHLRNIVAMLKIAGPKTLVLLDELGAGTDPAEGSALARAILDNLLKAGVPTIATTHYSELKSFAHDRPGVENASVEFDVATLSPTYRLLIGRPGRSNALAIAARLGLPESILEEARGELSDEHHQVETLLEGISRKEREAARERNRASREQQQLKRLRREAEGALEEAERIRQEAQEGAYREAEEELGTLRRQLARLSQQIERRGGTDRQAVARMQRDATVATERLATHRPRQPDTGPRLTSVTVGQTVRVPSFQQPGEVLTAPSERGEVEVQVGAFRVRVPLSELQAAPKRRQHEPATSFQRAERVSGPLASLSQPLDLRGFRVEEVEPLLERELNEAFGGGVPFVKIIHGHGSGAVRRVVRDFLSRQPYVSSFEPGSPADGGDGVTVVSLAI